MLRILFGAPEKAVLRSMMCDVNVFRKQAGGARFCEE
jgi:hypothetical protein